MPRKTIDNSQPWSIYDKRPYKELSRQKLEEICNRFRIADRQDFCDRFVLALSVTYRTNKLAFDEGLLTLRERVEHARAVEKAAAKFLQTLERLGPAMEEPLARMHLSDAAFDDEDDAKTSLSIKGLLEPEFGETHFLDLKAIWHGLKLIRINALSLADHYEERKTQRLPNKPMKHQARKVLMLNLFQFWEKERGLPITRNIETYNDDTGENDHRPGNEATQFCYDVCRTIDPSLTFSIVDQLMKDEIRRRHL